MLYLQVKLGIKNELLYLFPLKLPKFKTIVVPFGIVIFANTTPTATSSVTFAEISIPTLTLKVLLATGRASNTLGCAESAAATEKFQRVASVTWFFVSLAITIITYVPVKHAGISL